MAGSSVTGPGDRLLLDAQVVIERALETHAHLLTAGEQVVARRLLALSGPPGRAWARLVGRRRAVFRPAGLAWDDVPDVGAAVAALQAAGLVHGGLPWDRRLPVFTAPELRAACGALGLPRGGRREALEARLIGRAGWSRARVLRVSYRPLLRQLELLAFASPGRDRTALLAQVRAASPRPLWLRSLDPRRWRASAVFEAARALERQGELERARTLYTGLLASEGLGGPALALVLRRLGELGWRAARGLPDLLILPGAPFQLRSAVPAGVGPGALLVEIKGPTDTLRDGQSVWLDALARAGVRVELWNLRADPAS